MAVPVQGALTTQSSVQNSCVIKTLNAMSFGAYDPTSGTGQTTSDALTLVCTKAASVTVSPNQGQHNNLTMAGPSGNFLSYGLYSDAALSISFGAGNGAPFISPTSQAVCFSSETISPNGFNDTKPYATFRSGSTTFYYYNYVGQAGSGGCAGSLNTISTSGGAVFHNFSSGVAYSGTAASVNTPLVVNFYGNVPGSQNVVPGAYADVVTLSVTF
jgi:spore coat protein U-like protein